MCGCEAIARIYIYSAVVFEFLYKRQERSHSISQTSQLYSSKLGFHCRFGFRGVSRIWQGGGGGGGAYQPTVKMSQAGILL